MNLKYNVLSRVTAMALLIALASAGCAAAVISPSTSPTSAPQPSQTASAMPTPSDSPDLSPIVVTDPLSSGEPTGSAAPTANNSSAPAAGPAAVALGTAGNYVLLSKAGISTTGTTKITGNIGVSPIAASAITGFALVLDKSGTFARSSAVVGKIYAATYAVPTPTALTTAVKDMQTAYTNAAGRPAGVNELGAGNIGGLTLAPGVYKWGTNVTIPTNVTLSGGRNDVWIFQISGNLSISSAKQVILAGGAQAKNIFWQVAGSTTLGTTSTFNGTILCKTLIALRTGAVLNGRAYAQTAITLDANS